MNDSAGTVFANDSLPTILPSLTDFDEVDFGNVGDSLYGNGGGQVIVGNTDNSIAIWFYLDSFEPQVGPKPSSAFCLTVLSLFFVMRRGARGGTIRKASDGMTACDVDFITEVFQCRFSGEATADDSLGRQSQES